MLVLYLYMSGYQTRLFNNCVPCLIIFWYLFAFTLLSHAIFPEISCIVWLDTQPPESFNFCALCIEAFSILTHFLGTPISSLLITIPVIYCRLFFLNIWV